jgi:DNA-directed RNA polymerase subunit M/transcription elongation factor TFIIS
MEELRDKAKKILSSVMTKEKNVILFEKIIFLQTKKLMKHNEKYEDIYIKNLYQVILDIKFPGDKKLVDIYNNINTGKLHFNHESLQDNIYEEQEANSFLIKPFEIEEGICQCINCGSKKVYTYSKQSRSSDEPTSTFAECVKCHKKWVYSG